MSHDLETVGDKPRAKAQVARKCPYEKTNCTLGAKQMHFIDQLEGNNNDQAHEDPALYNDQYGLQNGAQLDIWQTGDGANWIKNSSDLAPIPWFTSTEHFSATGDLTNYPSVTNPGTVGRKHHG